MMMGIMGTMHARLFSTKRLINDRADLRKISEQDCTKTQIESVLQNNHAKRNPRSARCRCGHARLYSGGERYGSLEVVRWTSPTQHLSAQG